MCLCECLLLGLLAAALAFMLHSSHPMESSSSVATPSAGHPQLLGGFYSLPGVESPTQASIAAVRAVFRCTCLRSSILSILSPTDSFSSDTQGSVNSPYLLAGYFSRPSTMSPTHASTAAEPDLDATCLEGFNCPANTSLSSEAQPSVWQD